MADNRDPELLRKAAQALDSARAAEAKAEEAERDARRLRSEADSLVAAARRLYADAQKIGFNSNGNTAAPSDSLAPPAFVGGAGGSARPPNPPAPRGAAFWDNGSPTAVGWVALVVAVIALLLGLWLWTNRGDSAAVAKREAAAAIAPVAKDAADAKSAANKAVADASQAKADAANAVSTANDAKAAATTCSERCKPQDQKPTSKPRQRPAKEAYTPPQRPSAPPPAAKAPSPTAVADGGCIYSSDGTAILKGTNVRQPKGTELARISNAELMNSANPAIRRIVAAHSDGFTTNNGHLALCKAWSDYVATQIQSPEGLRVNNDTHRVVN